MFKRLDAVIILLMSLAAEIILAEEAGFLDSFSIDIEMLVKESPPAGTIISSENVTDFVQIIDPILVKQIQLGDVTLTVGEPFNLYPHPAYMEATRQLSAGVRLGAEKGELINYQAGRPFPAKPALEDDRAGEKIAWNMRHAYGGDNGVIPEMYWYFNDMKRERLEKTLEFSAKRMNFMHRVVMDPKPEVKRNSYFLQSAIHLEVHDPPDVSKTALLLYYKEDDRKVEQGWMYVPLLRRVRRIATQQKTDAFLGSDIMIEDFLGYSGRIMDMKWNYIGETKVLLPVYRHDSVELAEKEARRLDYQFVGFGGRGNCYPNITWQLRDAYIIEAIPYRDNHPLSKRRFYVDTQTNIATYGLIYDRAGELWKIAIGGVSHPDSHLAQNAQSGVPILDSSVMIDVQSRHCTTIQMVTLVNQKKMREKDYHPGVLNERGT